MEGSEGPWAPTNVETSAHEERILLESIQKFKDKMKKSSFFSLFLKQMCSKDVYSRLGKILGLEQKMNIVTYGIGNIDTNKHAKFCNSNTIKHCKFQLCVVLLMKDEFDWIGSLEIFDPIMTLKESNVLKKLGFSVLDHNEEGKRQVVKPTIFFMPYCPLLIYDNLISTNLKNGGLNCMTIIGSSFSRYVEISYGPERKQNILVVKDFMTEININTSMPGDKMPNTKDDLPDAYKAFGNMSWHFFCDDKVSSSLPGEGPKTGAMASIPCGICPRIRECTPDGLISPSNCVYFTKWLDF